MLTPCPTCHALNKLQTHDLVCYCDCGQISAIIPHDCASCTPATRAHCLDCRGQGGGVTLEAIERRDDD
jgi:hypothetical protein